MSQHVSVLCASHGASGFCVKLNVVMVTTDQAVSHHPSVDYCSINHTVCHVILSFLILFQIVFCFVFNIYF